MKAPRSSQRERLTLIYIAVATVVLFVAAFPFAVWDGRVLGVPEAGYLFLAPLAVWFLRPRGLLRTVAVTFLSFWVGWFILLFWLRHVTFFGTVALSAILAAFPLVWALAARRVLPWLETRKALQRVEILAGLAALWVLLEWLRSWIFSGFPWLPVAASQWSRPVMLQILPWTGALGLSWILVYFNLAIASYGAAFFRRAERGRMGFARPNPEIYIAFTLAVACMGLSLVSRNRTSDEPLFQAGIVQPYEPALLKWDPAEAESNLTRLASLTDEVSRKGAQVVFWPESATPWPVLSGDPTMRNWVEAQSSGTALPLVMGNMACVTDGKGGDIFYNGVFSVDPMKGLDLDFYAKRKLVPFGEYNPLAWLTDNFIKLPYNFFTPGERAELLPVAIPGGGSYKIGALLCYEDVFPGLARSEVSGGADFLFVATNNAWYGEEAGAYQHAVHSVLRAVENRRPVIRCGNGGWSGLIDEYGVIRKTCTREDKGVYFRGTQVFTMTRNPQWKGVITLYTRLGDWVVVLALLFGIRLTIILRQFPAKAPTPPAPTPEKPVANRSTQAGRLPRRGRRIGDE